jgi:hypothetical protein
MLYAFDLLELDGEDLRCLPLGSPQVALLLGTGRRCEPKTRLPTARLKALRLAAEAGNKDAAIRAAPKPAKRAVKKAATKIKGAPAQP